GLGDTIDAGRKIEVGDIQFNAGGVARFRADELSQIHSSDDGTYSAPDSGKSQIWGNHGLFDYSETFGSVHIYNSSDRELVTHLIDVVNGASNPLIFVYVNGIPGPTNNPADNVSLPENALSGVTFEFDIHQTYLPTDLDIRNLQPDTVAASNI